MPTDLIPALWVIGPACLFLLLAALRQPSDGGSRLDGWLNAAACVLAFLGLLWFLRIGHVPWNQQDWRDTDIFYRSVLEAMRRGQLPYLLLEEIPPTTLYWANPQTPLGPDLLLLAFFSVPTVYLVHTAIVFAAGCFGLLALRRELDLSPLAFALMLAVFTFNGHLLSHLNVGHGMWINVLLLPWVFVALIREGQHAEFARNGVTLVLTLAALVAFGAWHTFIGAAIFVGVFCVQSRRLLRFGALTLALLVPVIAFRLAPGLVMLGNATNEFLSGFDTTRLMYEAVATGWASPVLHDHRMGWWEYDTHITLAGFLVLWLALWPFRGTRYRALDFLYLPSFALAVLSYGSVYRDTLFKLPGLVSERISTRLLIIPVLALFVRGCLHLDRWLVRRAGARLAPKLAAYAASLVITVPLLFEAWRIRVPLGPLPVHAPLATWQTKIDPTYLWSVRIGLAISIVGLILVWYVATRDNPLRRRRAAP